MPVLIRSLLPLFILTILTPLQASATPGANPLRPLDCSSPLDTMESYIESIDAITAYLYGEHWNEPSEKSVEKINVRIKALMRLIDTSSFPPALRHKMATEALLHLAEVIRRIDPVILLSAPDERPGEELPSYWTVPDTEISIIRIEEGERAGEYVFSAETAERSIEYYELVEHLPVYGQESTWLNKREYLTPSGWMLSSSSIEAFPDWLKRPYLGQGLWKIIVLTIFIAFWVTLIFFTVRICRMRDGEQELARYSRKLCLPLIMIFISWNMQFVLFQLSLTSLFATGLAFTTSVMFYVGLAVLAMPLVMLFVELIIRSPHIAPDCLDAHLLRIGGRTAGLAIAITFLFLLSEQIGFPLYGVVAGVGIGGLAVALAARQSLENYLAGINLLSDRPMTIGDWCKYQDGGQDTFGEVLSVGMRSTRIRNSDSTVTSIPNSKLANMMITNLTARDGTYRFKKSLRLQMDSSRNRIDDVLDQIRIYLTEFGPVKDKIPHVHLENIGPDAINIRVACNLDTTDESNHWIRFLNLQQEILMRISDIVEKNGLQFAYPTTIIKNIGEMNRPEGPSTGISNAQHPLAD